MSRDGVSGFSLIKNNSGYIDVLFRYNSRVEEAYQRFWEVIGIKDFQEKRNEYHKNYFTKIYDFITGPIYGCF